MRPARILGITQRHPSSRFHTRSKTDWTTDTHVIHGTDLPDEPLRPGDRVRISALRDIGSARLLNGLLAEVVGPHPLVNGWYKIRLYENQVTPCADWSAPADRLKPHNEASEATTPGEIDTSRIGPRVKHFP